MNGAGCADGRRAGCGPGARPAACPQIQCSRLSAQGRTRTIANHRGPARYSGSQPLTPNGDTTYSSLSGKYGDGSPPSNEFPLKIKLINTETMASVVKDAGIVSSTSPTASTSNVNFDVTEKTPYVAIYYADVTRLGEANPEGTLCFMTGGTYTPTNTNIVNGERARVV